MKRMRLVHWLGGILFISQAAAASAAVLTYDLNLLIGGGPPVTSTASWGTLTIQDTEDANPLVSNGVRITVDVSGGSKVGELVLNFGPSPTPAFTFATILGGPVGSVTSSNAGAKADGYKGGFDLEIDFDTNSNPNEPVTFDLFSASLNLAPSDFDFFDTPDPQKGGGLTKAGVHIQSCDGTRSDCPSGNSIWIATSGPTTPPPPGPGGEIPEPSSLALLGLALSGLSLLRRRRP